MKRVESRTLYNLDYLHEISEGDTEFIHEMIRLFIVEIPSRLNKIILLLTEEKRQKATDEVHRIAPNFSLFGLEKMIERLNQAENCLRSGTECRVVVNELKCLRDEFNEVAFQLKSDHNIN